MSIKLKRRLTYATILLFNLCSGLGYAIIFPTIWSYIHDRLGGEASMLGVIISAYSFSAMLANPLVGWWSDKSLNTKNILLVTIMAEAVGSVLYFIGMHTWVLVIGRLIAGFGAGGGAAILADVTRTTSTENKTSVLSIVIALRQFGLIIGPAFNIFLSQADFHLFSFPVDKYTSPGLFMAFVWLLLEVVVLFSYQNLTTLQNEEEMENLFQKYNSGLTGSIFYQDLDDISTLEVTLTSSYPPYVRSVSNPTDPTEISTLPYSSSQPNLQVEWLENGLDDITSVKKEEIETIKCQQVLAINNFSVCNDKKSILKKVRKSEERAGSVSDGMIESAERLMSGSYGSCTDKKEGSRRVSSTNPSTPYSSEAVSIPDESTSLVARLRPGQFRDEIVVLLGLAFISCFAQTVLETIITPLTQKYYNFTEMENSYVYLVAGIEVIVVFATIKFISRKVSDRVLIAFGLLTLAVSMVLPMLYLPYAVPGDKTTLVYFIISFIIDLIGIPTIVVCSSSLLSKKTNEDSQALFQGFRRGMGSLGCIMGPLWGGAYLFNTYWLFSVPLAVIGLISVLFLMSYKKLHVERN